MKELFTGVLNISITASILIIACILVRLIFRNMPKFARCLMWLLVAVRLAIPFAIESPFSVLPEKEYISVDSTEESREVNVVLTDSAGNYSNVAEMDVSNEDKTANNSQNVYLSEHKGDKAFKGENIKEFDIFEILSVIWVAGIVSVLIYALIIFIKLKKSVFDAVKLSDNIYQSERVETAFVLGLFRPQIYVPYGLKASELYMAINHERAHISRRDHLVKPLGFIIAAVYWFNPLVWYAYVLLCRDIELACDEKVIKKIGYDKKKDYSQAILNLSIPKKYISACPVAFGEVGVDERVKNVLKMKKGKKIILAIALAVCGILAICFLTYPRDTEAKNKENTATTENEIAAEATTEAVTEAEAAAENEAVTEAEATTENELGKEIDAAVETETVDEVEEALDEDQKETQKEAQKEAQKVTQIEEASGSNLDKEINEDFGTEISEVDESMTFNAGLWPVLNSGIVTRQFSSEHKGIDIAAEEGTSVVNLFVGIVEEADFDEEMGYYVKIFDEKGYTYTYAHLQEKPLVTKGDSVSAGREIGTVGNTGRSTGPHLHLEIADDKGTYIDPMTILEQ